MPEDKILTLAISSRALFDLNVGNEIYEQEGLDAYRRYQIEHEDDLLEPGEGFSFVSKLLNINKLLGKPRVEVIMLSRNSADTGLRIFNSIQAHNLQIHRAAFCSGKSPYRYIQAFDCDLFLSTDGSDVAQALSQGVAAATLIGRGQPESVSTDSELKLAFDGDAVIFSDEAERVYQQEGLETFAKKEAAAATEPLEGGPFKPFLHALHTLQREFDEDDCPIRTALVTARSAPSHERVIRTLRAWDIRLDESLFLGGMEKTQFLRAFGADIFFDDQVSNTNRASLEVPSGHVPHGVKNEI